MIIAAARQIALQRGLTPLPANSYQPIFLLRSMAIDQCWCHCYKYCSMPQWLLGQI